MTRRLTPTAHSVPCPARRHISLVDCIPLYHGPSIASLLRFADALCWSSDFTRRCSSRPTTWRRRNCRKMVTRQRTRCCSGRKTGLSYAGRAQVRVALATFIFVTQTECLRAWTREMNSFLSATHRSRFGSKLVQYGSYYFNRQFDVCHFAKNTTQVFPSLLARRLAPRKATRRDSPATRAVIYTPARHHDAIRPQDVGFP